MYRKTFLWLFLVFFGSLSFAAPAQPVEPLFVEGNFSSKTSLSAQTQVFDQKARNAEIASLNQQLKDRKFLEVIKRINDLTAKDFLDNRFHLLLAIAYDGLFRYDDVIYSASQAIAVAPQDSRPYLLRAGAYLNLQNYDRCRMDLDAALKLNPSSKLAVKLEDELNKKMFIKKPEPEKKKPVSQKGKKWPFVYVGTVLVAVLMFGIFGC